MASNPLLDSISQYSLEDFFSKDVNNEKTSDLFYKKTFYEGTFVSEYSNLTNFNFGEKLLYGRVNRKYIPIEGNFGRYGLKYFSRNQTVSTPQRAANYVVDAFNAMAQQFNKCALLGKIDTNDPYLTNLVVHRAYENPRTMYESYYDSYVDAIQQTFANEKTQVKDFGHFLTEMFAVVSRSARVMPFTYTAFIKSRRCPVSISGLSIDLAPLDPNNDVDKIDKFYKSRNWDFFVNTCKSYGFMVDKNIPWRIVADIGSSEMIKRAQQYSMNSTQQILNGQYAPAYVSYYRTFKQRLLTLYNRIKPSVITNIEECNGQLRNNLTFPATYSSISQIEELFSEEQFMRLYFNIRFAEEESAFTENEKEIIIDDLIEVYHSGREDLAFAYFERILNKTFDYHGSLSYIIKAQKSRAR
jgi:hypothetical protein